MSRVKRGMMSLKKRHKVLKAVKGFRGARGRNYKAANEALLHSLIYAFRDRRVRKRDFRSLWITRINAAARENGLTYGQMINGLKNAGITLDRKNLAELAISSPGAFARLAEQAKGAAKKPTARAAAR